MNKKVTRESEDLIICGFCGKQLKGIVYHSKDGDSFCGMKHEKLCINRTNIFNEQVARKLIQSNKKVNCLKGD